ncbi:Aldose 1-epimerase [uncultured Eubacteriales bacterium]|uniref:Aldose 1-epimerase n=1 Tax=uncultured Eubacteriales bacterium TaxID=172733 RepID=A0A212KH02_9FIRM|nr:Aldose 1-epimerase [uncultured Eubacteriales bacterium]
MIEIKNSSFGKTGAGKPVSCWTLTNDAGMSAEILTYGGILRTLTVPVAGRTRDVVLGFDDMAGYEGQDAYIGAVVGRVANRIGGARFTLDGKEYPLPANRPPNCLHGGVHGFNEKVWAAETQDDALVLSLTSPDGEEGFPGTLRVKVIYALGEDNSLSIEYVAEADAPTPVNLTNHSYFNLKGAGSGTAEDHVVQIFADRINENNDVGVPTGWLMDVEGTPFDLREGRPLAEGLADDHPQMVGGGGYDRNYIMKTSIDGALQRAAVAECAGLRMECLTTQPGLQIYTANYLATMTGKGGKAYTRRSALCLETQNWPDAVNHRDFPTSILRPGQTYHQTTIYRFTEL